MGRPENTKKASRPSAKRRIDAIILAVINILPTAAYGLMGYMMPGIEWW